MPTTAWASLQEYLAETNRSGAETAAMGYSGKALFAEALGSDILETSQQQTPDPDCIKEVSSACTAASLKSKQTPLRKYCRDPEKPRSVVKLLKHTLRKGQDLKLQRPVMSI
jgi:hypothetical protein